jgi:hypothetical protein
MSILLLDRRDRLGCNFLNKLCLFIMAKNNNYQVYHEKNFKYYDNIFMIPFIKFSIELDKNIMNEIKFINKKSDIHHLCINTVNAIKQDIPSYFEENLKESFFSLINNKFCEYNFKKPWEDNKVICIHLRCDDVYNYEGRNTNKHFDYISDIINKGVEIEVNKFRNKMRNDYGFSYQSCLSILELKNLVDNLRKTYSNYEIYVIYKNPIREEYLEFFKKHNLKTIKPISKDPNINMNYDLFLLIHSDILVITKSIYGLLASFFHQGSKTYYPRWCYFGAIGLGSKYNKSKYIIY